MSNNDSTVPALMRAADAYAKDHYIEGRWADSREELETALVDALTPPERPVWKVLALSAAIGLAGWCVPYIAVTAWDLHQTRQTLLTVIEQRDRLAARADTAAEQVEARAHYKPCDPSKPRTGVWIETGGHCWEVR